MKKILISDYLEPGLDFHLKHYKSYSEQSSVLHCHNFYEFFLMLDGRLLHIVNQKKKRLKKGDLIFIRPNDSHYFMPTNNMKSEYINLAFTISTLQSLFFFLGKSQRLAEIIESSYPEMMTLSSHQLSLLEKKIIFLSVKSTQSHANLEFKKLLFELITIYLLDSNSLTTHKSIDPWLTALSTEMYKQQNFSQGLKRMVALSGVTNEHLSRVFKTYYKVSPQDFITEIRMNYASNMLMHTNESILNISFRCGYESISHFHHVFKKKFKLTPHMHRKKHAYTEYKNKVR